MSSRGYYIPLDDLTGAQLEGKGDATVDALRSGQRSADGQLEPIQRGAGHTGIKLLSAVLEGATVVHRDLVSLLRLALAVDRDGDLDLQLGAGDDAYGGRGEDGEEECGLHRGRFGRGWSVFVSGTGTEIRERADGEMTVW